MTQVGQTFLSMIILLASGTCVADIPTGADLFEMNAIQMDDAAMTASNTESP